LDTKARVARAIPKGHGEPLDIVKHFAIWAAWKRGNECIPHWAYPEYVPEDMAIGAGQKLSAAALKRLDQDASQAAKRRNPERVSQKKQELGNIKEEGILPEPTVPNSVAFTSLRKSACAQCRKRRIRCKHREDSELQPLDLANSLAVGNIAVGSSPGSKDLTTAPSTLRQDFSSLKYPDQVAPISLDQTVIQMAQSSVGKRVRAQACDTCRKSKVCCILIELNETYLFQPAPMSS
jgi:F-box/leucine-rich repeat protein 10/11